MTDPVLVVIPTRHRPAFLAEALGSVLAQDDPDWVAVVADDGDAEPTAPERAAAARGDARIAFCRATTRSAGGARNAALAFAESWAPARTARLVAFLDDDDLWLPGHLRASRRALDAQPRAPFVHGAAVTRGTGGDSAYHARETGPMDGDLFAALLHRDIVATSSAVARREDLAQVGGFRADLRHGEDWDLWLRLARRGPAAWVAEPLVVHRDHDGNLSRQRVSKGEDQAAMLETWWASRHRLSPTERRVLRRELARRHRRFVHRLLEEGGRPRAESGRSRGNAGAACPTPRRHRPSSRRSCWPRGRAAPPPTAT